MNRNINNFLLLLFAVSLHNYVHADDVDEGKFAKMFKSIRNSAQEAKEGIEDTSKRLSEGSINKETGEIEKSTSAKMSEWSSKTSVGKASEKVSEGMTDFKKAAAEQAAFVKAKTQIFLGTAKVSDEADVGKAVEKATTSTVSTERQKETTLQKYIGPRHLLSDEQQKELDDLRKINNQIVRLKASGNEEAYKALRAKFEGRSLEQIKEIEKSIEESKGRLKELDAKGKAKELSEEEKNLKAQLVVEYNNLKEDLKENLKPAPDSAKARYDAFKELEAKEKLRTKRLAITGAGALAGVGGAVGTATISHSYGDLSTPSNAVSMPGSSNLPPSASIPQSAQAPVTSEAPQANIQQTSKGVLTFGE